MSTTRSIIDRILGSLGAGGIVRSRSQRRADRLAGVLRTLISERGEASGAALARRAVALYRGLDPAGRGHFFGESFGRVFAGVIAPFLMASHTGTPAIFFGTMVVVVALGACIPLAFGRETLGNLETFTETVPELA